MKKNLKKAALYLGILLCFLNAITAKALGKEKGRVIEFTAFQSFLKEFYSEAFPEGASNTVAL